MSDVAVRIQRAADEFDWASVDQAASDYAGQLWEGARRAAKSEYKPVLDILRGHRRHKALTEVIDALLSQGVSDAVVRRLYGQALIEQGYPAAALLVLSPIAKDPKAPKSEKVEARGSMGRCHKELYLRTTDRPRRADYLRKALAAYVDSYREAPRTRYWSGINAVALLARADDERISIPEIPSPRGESQRIAASVLRTVRSKPDSDGWAQATAVEAFVAEGRTEDAVAQLERFLVMSKPDAFTVNSLLRQLTEIWLLDTETLPGSTLLPQLRSELLRKIGGVVSVDVRDVQAERLERLPESFEKVLGADRYQTLNWYIKGLERCRAVARIETENEDGIGTGFLVHGTKLHPSLPPVVLMTNGHVIPEWLDHQDAVVAFHSYKGDSRQPQRFKVVRQWWYRPSQAPELDTTLLELDGLPGDVTPVPTAKRIPSMRPDASPRAYVIGHPRGLEQPQFSLQDNHLLGSDETRLHYRSPTDPGSSGSPVFDNDWNLIGIHHAGSVQMPRLDGKPGLYAANEGIRVSAIVAALGEFPPAP